MTQRNPSHAVTAAAPGRWLVLAIVSSALLLIVVDMTVLYTALPRLTHELGAVSYTHLDVYKRQRHHRVRALPARLAQQELQLAQLVAAAAQRHVVVALHIEAHAVGRLSLIHI